MSVAPKPTMNHRKETHYEVLKVSPRATVAEIVSAYHTAKNAFSKDSVATYSLFSPEEAQAELKRLEEAYLTLSNIEKRSDYDRRLLKGDGENDAVVSSPPPSAPPVSLAPVSPSVVDSEEPLEVEVIPAPAAIYAPVVPPSTETAAPVPEASTASLPNVTQGATLKGLREARGLSIDDVARITKIPSKFIAAIEREDRVQLPARVYVQGFVKNLATLYKLDPVTASKTYLQHLERS